MLGEICARLTAELPTPRWAGVMIAEDVDVLRDLAGRVADAAAIVMPFRERGGAQELMTGGFRQLVEEQFAVGIVLRDQGDAFGADRAQRFDDLKADVEAALAGWEPAGREPCELVGGESSPISKGVSIYVQTWATARFLTGV